eukprot:gnl/TRDRNA2_/TRDRNA2_181682_c0_seq1.p1 gnl/TRDRNA2_/TRDRNA2_181682_c0~~gnl/TRDRNA2_/TRDRNA2_181682_c0_seq1.p1  ORF type:complete len:200 (-),score=38.07 gnl/TRDRNA2_/TRDRNA2_181682_c0_seq1:192-791(-)
MIKSCAFYALLAFFCSAAQDESCSDPASVLACEATTRASSLVQRARRNPAPKVQVADELPQSEVHLPPSFLEELEGSPQQHANIPASMAEVPIFEVDEQVPLGPPVTVASFAQPESAAVDDDRFQRWSTLKNAFSEEPPILVEKMTKVYDGFASRISGHINPFNSDGFMQGFVLVAMVGIFLVMVFGALILMLVSLKDM